MIKILDNLGKTCDQYTVIVDDSDQVSDIWFMSDNANMPNGVCMYGGLTSDYNWQDLGLEIDFDDLPIGTKKQLSKILTEYY